jgi:glutamyl-tRNA synthetase
MQLLGCAPPSYWHVPLLRDEAGQRLAKRDGSEGLEQWRCLGGRAEGLIGQWAAQLGWLPAGAELSAEELLAELKRCDDKRIAPKATPLIPKQ